MKGILDVEAQILVGEPIQYESVSPANSFGVVFEDDGDTGYFYALNTDLTEPILDAVHIYNVGNVVDRDMPSKLQIIWAHDGLKAALLINDYFHAVFDFESNRGYCRTGFPPPGGEWSKQGHEWDDGAYELFT